MKQQKGITLIALVVTIVVLLILAAISINIAFGNNGIFKQAQMAAGSTANAIDYEANTLGQQMEDFIENSVGSIGNQTPNPEPPEENYEYYLVDKVNVGDYVAYDAGTWNSTVSNPTSNASFGGYTEGQNKGTSIGGSTSGWRVLKKEGSGATGIVTLISAGSPANGYYSEGDSQSNEMITGLNNFAVNNFLNPDLATSVRNADYNTDYSQMNSAGVINTGYGYWLASRTSREQEFGSDPVISGYLYRHRIEDDGTEHWFNFGYTTIYNNKYSGPDIFFLYAIRDSGGIEQSTIGVISEARNYTNSSTTTYHMMYNQDSGSLFAEPVGSLIWNATSTAKYFDNSGSAIGVRNALRGVRPIIILKEGVMTSETKDMDFLGQLCWRVVPPSNN